MYMYVCQQKNRHVLSTLLRQYKKKSKIKKKRNREREREFDFNIEALEIFQSNSLSLLSYLCIYLFDAENTHTAMKEIKKKKRVI